MFQLEIDAFSASTVRNICYYENVLEFCDDGERCQTLKVFAGLNLNDAAFPIRHTIAALTHYSRSIDTNKQLKMVTRNGCQFERRTHSTAMCSTFSSLFRHSSGIRALNFQLMHIVFGLQFMLCATSRRAYFVRFDYIFIGHGYF